MQSGRFGTLRGGQRHKYRSAVSEALGVGIDEPAREKKHRSGTEL